MCLEQKRFWIALPFVLWCRQKETHPAMEREKSETFKRWRNVYMLFAESLFLASNEKIMPDRFVLCLAYTAIVRVQ